MPFVDEAVNACQEHLTKTNSFNTEIEAFLVQYLLVVICAEYEKAVKASVQKKGEAAADPRIAAFVASAIDNVVRDIRIGSLAGVLGRFGEDLKTAFTQQVLNSPAQVAYDNIVTNRHSVAHGSGGVQLTFNELLQQYETSKQILEEFQARLQ